MHSLDEGKSVLFAAATAQSDFGMVAQGSAAKGRSLTGVLQVLT